jgi:phosphoribosylformimino-5-aminoimidazole carboxamide ribotide isomerase
VKNKMEVLRWGEVFGNEKLFIGADIKNGKIAVNGWLQESDVTIESLIEDYLKEGINNFFCTDVSKDGMLSGPAVGLYKNLIASYPTLRLIASGGVSKYDDLIELRTIGCDGVIIGKAFYERKISMEELKVFEQGDDPMGAPSLRSE